MTLSLFYFAFWLIMRGSSFVRPSALHRGYVLIWLFSLGWGLQVICAVLEDRMHIAALYSTVFLQSAIFLALLISLLEQFGLLGKHEFALQLHDAHQARDVPNHDQNQAAQAQPDQEPDHSEEAASDTEDATERTPLRAGEPDYGSNAQPSFANTYRRSVAGNAPAPPRMRRYQPFDHEQTWSGRLPSWTWVIQFLLLAPVPVILFGNLGLIVMSALQMTGTDGGSLLVPLVSLGVLSILLLIPLTPFIHRVSHHVPLFLLCVFIGTFVYNLVAFPFSSSHRFKFYFQQVVDLDNSTSTVSIMGLEGYAHEVMKFVPSLSNQEPKCEPGARDGLVDCQYDASSLPPNLVEGKAVEKLISVKTMNGTNGSVRLQIHALDTRLCYVQASQPVYGFAVEGGVSRDPRFGKYPPEGFQRIQIWRRDRDRPWNLTLFLNERSKSFGGGADSVEQSPEGQDGELKARSADWVLPTTRKDQFKVRISCAWSDANEPGTIPAFDELLKYMPTWAAVTKKNVGLVEVRKTYTV